MKEKIAFIFLKINIPLMLFIAYFLKICLESASFASGFTLLVITLTYTISKYFKLREPQKRPDRVKEEVDKISGEVKEIKAALSKVNVTKINQSKKYF